ncbi:Protein dehydration-induced 19-like 4 [Vitis vinifera]|uniref:Protein dehydration-induced 19-like 4 n=1 Tax=Vitis vinifera TaxID=29760 RepID=A0A438BSV2_VITVI|nr:Protein dehydration-induced 19-like 4 [Vitis vinifera]
MDSDHWSSRLAVAKRQYMLHQTNKSHSDRLCIDDLEVEDDIPCPYCYEDHDIASLCSHLEDEHSFESRVAVTFQGGIEIEESSFG